MTNKRKSSGPSCSSKVVMLPSGPRICSIRKQMPVFSLFKPGGTSNNSSRSTSSLSMLMGIKRFDHKTKVKARSER